MQDFPPNKIPNYAILSHTWGNGEVSFQDVERKTYKQKAGFTKIQNFFKQALKDGYEWVWVDTCCIDKTSSAELSEAINSMYKWYRDAVVCYAYLEDLEQSENLHKCRWFTRGWTLQELIAPASVIFFNVHWNEMGTRSRLVDELSTITRIPEKILLGKSPSYCNIAHRMSWASSRETSREEYMAYCLLGLFDLNMVPMYGEGSENAFLRLQQEILQRNSDQTIFLWTHTHDRGNSGLLATSPKAFCTHRACFGWLHWVEGSSWFDESEQFDPYSALIPDRSRPSELKFNENGKEQKFSSAEDYESYGVLGPHGLQISLLAARQTPYQHWGKPQGGEDDDHFSKLVCFDVMASGRLDRCRVYLLLHSEQRDKFTGGFTPNRLGHWIRSPNPLSSSEYLLHPLQQKSFRRERISVSQISALGYTKGNNAYFTLRSLGLTPLIGDVGVVREGDNIHLLPFGYERFECSGGVVQIRHDCNQCDSGYVLCLMFGTRARNLLPWCSLLRRWKEPTSMMVHSNTYRYMAVTNARLQEHSRYPLQCGLKARAKIDITRGTANEYVINLSMET